MGCAPGLKQEQFEDLFSHSKLGFEAAMGT
jgi:hypothetical protein